MEEEQNKNLSDKASVLHFLFVNLAAVRSQVSSIVCCYQCNRLQNNVKPAASWKGYRHGCGPSQSVVAHDTLHHTQKRGRI